MEIGDVKLWNVGERSIHADVRGAKKDESCKIMERRLAINLCGRRATK